MVGPILVDASAQATPQSSCVSGGVCLTPVANTTVTIPVTTTRTVTTPVTTTTTVLGTTTVPVTTTQTTTVPVTTRETITVPVTTTDTTRVPVTTTVGVTTTTTVTAPVTTTTTTTTAPVTTTTTTTTTSVIPAAIVNNRRGRSTSTTTTGQCTPPGQTSRLAGGQVETCGPDSGRVAVYATAPGLYTTIFDNDSTDYVSAGIFAPQYRNGHLTGCYYVPDRSSVTAPGQTSNVGAGVLADAVAFGPRSWNVSGPLLVPRSDCS
jgi:hypothetical protein